MANWLGIFKKSTVALDKEYAEIISANGDGRQV
jgi:hypothetical protein